MGLKVTIKPDQYPQDYKRLWAILIIHVSYRYIDNFLQIRKWNNIGLIIVLLTRDSALLRQQNWISLFNFTIRGKMSIIWYDKQILKYYTLYFYCLKHWTIYLPNSLWYNLISSLYKENILNLSCELNYIIPEDAYQAFISL